LTQFPNSVYLLIKSPIDSKITTILVMHAFGITIISFMWIVSRRNTQIQHVEKTPL